MARARAAVCKLLWPARKKQARFDRAESEAGEEAGDKDIKRGTTLSRALHRDSMPTNWGTSHKQRKSERERGREGRGRGREKNLKAKGSKKGAAENDERPKTTPPPQKKKNR